MASNIILNSNCIKFQIKIKDFSKTQFKNGDSHRFDFTFGPKKLDKNWSVQVFPNGGSRDSKGFMSIFLEVLSDLRDPVQVFFQVSFLNSKGNEKVIQSFDHLFESFEKDWGWSKYINREELMDPVLDLLKDDILTLSCKIKYECKAKFVLQKSIRNFDSKSFQQLVDLRLLPDFTIKVKDEEIKVHRLLLAEASGVFLEKCLDLGNPNTLEINDLEFEIVREIVNFIYDGRVGNIADNAESLLKAAILYQIDELKQYCLKSLYENMTPENAIATWKIAVENETRTLEIACLEYIGINIKNIVTHNWANFVTESPKLFHKIFSYISKKLEDNLANFYKEIAMESVEMSTSKLYEDYEHLFTEKLFADVELIVDGKQIKAHKAILSIRSTVFKAMFENDTLESAKNQVLIEDFDFETINELLRYLYSQRVENMNEIAFELLKAADKYNLLDLKELCAKSLGNNLTVENVISYLSVAGMHNCPGLKMKAFAFVGRNIALVTERQEWEKFIEVDLELLNEMFLKWISDVC